MKKGIIVALLLSLIMTNNVLLPVEAKSTKKVLEGKYISILGDSISTYEGYSDSAPITAEDCQYRYGEAYYGPIGSQCNNTDLLVSDTWWHQAAEELGATTLMVNSGNSTGLMCATSTNADWQQYLTDMLGYKTRPDYLDKYGKNPDIIAIYMGSNDAAKVEKSKFGSLDAINFDDLITDNGDGTFTYAEPETVAEAYSIMLHKIQNNYPDAELYCFTVLPNAGGDLTTGNKRVAIVEKFNKMVKDVADHYGAVIVDLFDAFQLDQDGDAAITQEEWDQFKTYFHEDPHPNAAGFDVITKCFVDAVNDANEEVVMVETTGGHYEEVVTEKSVDTSTGEKVLKRKAVDYVTESGMKVNYESSLDKDFEDSYTVESSDGTYTAAGGNTKIVHYVDLPIIEIDIPLACEDDPETDVDETTASVVGYTTVTPEFVRGEQREDDNDGSYNYWEITVGDKPKVVIRTSKASVSEFTPSVDYTEMNCIKSDVEPTDTNEMITGVDAVTAPDTYEVETGYDYLYIGSDELSKFFSSYLFNRIIDDKAELVYEDDTISLYTAKLPKSDFVSRKLTVPKLYLNHITVDDGTRYPSFWCSTQLFTLIDRSGNVMSAYCADRNTDTLEYYNYKLENLEDADYYSTEDAKMIRTVTSNGYWGTSEGFGSLQSVKDMMRESGQFTEEEIAMLDEGMAMAATQQAIWSFSSREKDDVFTNCYYSDLVSFYKRGSGVSYDADDSKVAVIVKLRQYLCSLEPTDLGTINSTINSNIINEKNFIKSTSVKLTGKVSTSQNNADEDETNDVYYADISFELNGVIDEEKDSLVMTLYDEDGYIIAKGRIAGQLQDGEVQLTMNDAGKYTFTNIPLTENETAKISFELEGYQYLEKMPYLLTSEIKDYEGEEDVPSQH